MHGGTEARRRIFSSGTRQFGQTGATQGGERVVKPTTASAAPSADLEIRWCDINRRILAASPHPWTQGNICRKWDRGGHVWRLRYYERLGDGRPVQRTIRIGRDPVLVH